MSLQAKSLGDVLVVGIHSDGIRHCFILLLLFIYLEEVAKHKGLPVMRDTERLLIILIIGNHFPPKGIKWQGLSSGWMRLAYPIT